MNYWIKSVLIFIGGAGIGALTSAIICKKKYEKIAEEEIAQMQAYYKKIYEEYEVSSAEEYDEEIDKDLEEQAKAVAKDFVPYDYSRSSVDIAETEHPEDDENEKKSSKNKPKLVKATECQLQSLVTLYYYTKDGTITVAADSEGGYQSESPLDDEEIEETVGECLDKYGFKTNEEDIIHVYSPARNEYYQVIKVRYSYADPDSEE